MSHATLAPSAASRWIPCPGSVAYGIDVPNPESDYADEGTAAHHWGALALATKNDVAYYIGQGVTPREGGKDYILDEETAGYIQAYVDDVRSRAAGGMLMVEQRMEFTDTLEVREALGEQKGTGDAVIIAKDGRHLIVEDLKFGLGVKVFAKGNEQGLMYIVAALETYAPIIGDVEEFTFVVHQPRLDHVDEWTYTRAEIDEFIERAKLSAKYAIQGMHILEMDGMDGLLQTAELFSPGDKQCRFCKRLAECPAAQRRVAEETYGDFAALSNPAELMTRGEPQVPAGERLGAAFGVLDYIEGWCRAVRAEVERMVQAGLTVIGPDGLPMKLIQGKRGNRYWWDEEAAEAALAGLLPPEKIYKPKEIVSVAVAEKALGKKRKADFEAALLPFIRQKDGSLKVALGSDPAPAYSGEASASEFPTQNEEA